MLVWIFIQYPNHQQFACLMWWLSFIWCMLYCTLGAKNLGDRLVEIPSFFEFTTFNTAVTLKCTSLLNLSWRLDAVEEVFGQFLFPVCKGAANCVYGNQHNWNYHQAFPCHLVLGNCRICEKSETTERCFLNSWDAVFPWRAAAYTDRWIDPLPG